MRFTIYITIVLLASACSGTSFNDKANVAGPPAASAPVQIPPNQGVPDGSGGSPSGSDAQPPPEGIDIPNNVSGAALTCNISNTAGVKQSVDLGCHFTIDRRQRVPKEKIAQNVRFFYSNSNDAVTVSMLEGGADHDVIYRVGAQTSADATNGALNLQLTAVLENPDQVPSKITALARAIVIDRWLVNGDSISDSGDCIDESCVMMATSTSQNWVRSTLDLLSFPEAAAQCDNLDYIGHTDWRLPAEVEIYFAVQEKLPEQAPIKDRLTAGFPVTATYWTATQSVDQYWVNRFDGVVSSLPPTAKAGVICVR